MQSIVLSQKELLANTYEHYSSQVITYSPNVIRVADVFVVEVDDLPTDSVSEAISSQLRVLNLTFTHAEMERLPHELIMSLFSKEKPKKVSELGLGQHDDQDNKCPDLITDSICFELGTSFLGANDAYEHKRAKYTKLCETRNLQYYVLGVGPGDAKSNFELTDKEYEDIIMLYAVGKNIQQKAAVLGFVFPRGRDEDNARLIDTSMVFVSEENIPKSFLNISKEKWNEWSEYMSDNQYTMDYKSTNVYSDLIICSTNEMSKRVREQTEVGSGHIQDIDYYSNYKAKTNELPTKPQSDEKHLAVPLALVEEGEFSFDGHIDSSCALGELWQDAKEYFVKVDGQDVYEKYKGEVKTVREELDLRQSKEHRSRMREQNRIRTKLTRSHQRELSENGLLGRRYGKRIDKLNKQTSLGYSLMKDYNVDDIDKFVNNRTLHKFYKTNTKVTLTEDLLSAAQFDFDSVSGEFFQDFMNSRLGHCLSFLSSLFSEINLNYRKPTKTHEFYVTTVPHYKAALLLHNTGTGKHTFYTVLVNKKDVDFLECLQFFRPWNDIGDFYALELSSTRRHDVSNVLFCMSKVMAMAATHLEVFGEELQFNKYADCLVEFYFHTLVYLENSNQVSEMLQQVRFFYMKTNSSKAVTEPIMSPVEKLPDIIRTRLGYYAVKKLLTSFLKMSSERNKIKVSGPEEKIEIEPEEAEFSEDMLKGVYSYISGRPLNNYEEALLLSYGGIYHNKSKADHLTANLQIYRKLTKEELNLDENHQAEYMDGFKVKDSMTMPPHGFDGSHIKNCGLNLLEELQKKGINFSDMKQRVAVALNKVTYEELATFKSSLESDHLEMGSSDEQFCNKYPDLKYLTSAFGPDGKYKYGRTCKALEGVLKVLSKLKIDDKVRPFHMISSLIDQCNKRGGIVAILFKKAQFGSVREIFILTMFARIVVKFMETVAREVAEMCPNEYLTKGSAKLNSTPNHYSRIKAAKSAGDVVMNIYDSLDCKTWCQNFTFPAFGQLFAVLFREWPELSNTIRVIFNMASSKRHEMTETLMKSFTTHQEVKSMSESMNVLKEEFLGNGGKLNVGHQSIFVNNVSNFMQGIFHYTSTVLHSAHLLMMSRIMKAFMYETDYGYIRTIIHTTKCSSDDGSSLFSVILKDPTDDCIIKTRFKLLICSEMLMRSYPLMCAWVGLPKSTRFVENGVEEFNSLWTFRNTVLSVPSKFTTAAVVPKITKSCIERQRVDHNSLNACVENGCSMNLVKILEFACAMNHYIITGLESHSKRTWKLFAEDLMDLPHPACWVYIASPKIAGTTLGFEPTLRNHLNKSEEARKVHYVVTELMSGSFDLKSGLLVQSSITIGSTKKYYEFLRRTLVKNKEERLLDYLETNPSMLYRESTSADDVTLKIYLKAKAPGAERSFIFEDESAIHAISSYVMSSASLTVSTKVKNTLEWERNKMSLPAYLQKINKLLNSNESVNPIEMHAETILSMLETYREVYIPIGRRRKLPVKIRFPKSRSQSPISLSSCAKFIWFAISNGYTVQQNNQAFSDYMEINYWLDKNYFDTMNNIKKLGVEGNVHTVINGLLQNEIDSDRTIMFMHSGKRESTIMSSYMSCLEYCQCKNSRLARPKEIMSKTDLGEFLELEKKLYPYVNIAQSIRKIISADAAGDAVQEVYRIIKEHEALIRKPRSEREVRFLPKRLKNLLAIATLMLSPDNQEIEQTLLDYTHGFIIIYVKPQEKVVDEYGKRHWTGKGIFHVITRSVKFRLEVYDSTLESVSSTKPNEITQHLEILSKVLKSLKITSSVQKRSPECIKVLENHIFFSTSRGAPVRQLTFSETMLNLQYEVETRVDIKSGMISQVRVVNWKGKMKSDPIRFRPVITNRTECNWRLTRDKAIGVVCSLAKVPEEHPIWQFCSNSINDRVSRLGFKPQSNYDRLFDTIVSHNEEDEVDVTMSTLLRDMMEEEFELGDALTIINEIPVTVAEDSLLEVGILDLQLDMENIIDEINLFAEIKTVDTLVTNLEELELWDDMIYGIEEYTSISLRKLITGDYVMPANPILSKYIRMLVELRVIKEPVGRAYQLEMPEFDLTE